MTEPKPSSNPIRDEVIALINREFEVAKMMADGASDGLDWYDGYMSGLTAYRYRLSKAVRGE